MKLNFEMFIKKLHHYQKVSCVNKFKRRFFYFLYCIFSKYVFYSCEMQIIIVPDKFMWILDSCVDFWNFMKYSYQDFCCLTFHEINLIWETQVEKKEVIVNELRKNYESSIY